MNTFSVKKSGSLRVRPVRLKNVAEAAKVSITTVSMALSGHPNIGEDTRRRIARISAEMGYQPKARRLARSRQGKMLLSERKPLSRVGFMLLGTSLNNAANSSILQSLANHCTEEQIALQMAAVESCDQTELFTERTLALAKDVDGLILMGYVDAALLRALRAQEMPHVVLGYTKTTQREALENNVHVISNDDAAMGQLATETLFAAGHRRIAFICETLPRGLSHWRWRDGYATAHLSAGVAMDESLIHVSGVEHSSGDSAAEAMLQLASPPTAYVVPDPRIAAMFLDAMRRRNVDVARDCVIIGCDPTLVDRYGVGDYPRVEYDNESLVAMGLRQLRHLYEHSTTCAATIQMPFTYRNLPAHS